jgi:hypothetical protein
MFQASKRCYCAFCRTKRTVYLHRHVSAPDVLLALAASILLSFVFWQELDPRLLVLFAIGLGIAEVFIVIRWRVSIACPHCGFDPVLYKKSPQLAVSRVKSYMALRREDPMSAFSPPPKLPVLMKRPKELDS